MSLPIPTFLKSSYPVVIPTLPTREVCPKCRRVVTVHHFQTGDFTNVTHHCRINGDIPTPMRSAIWHE